MPKSILIKSVKSLKIPDVQTDYGKKKFTRSVFNVCRTECFTKSGAETTG